MGLAIPIAKTGGLFVRLEIDGQIPKGNLCHISRMAFDITSDVYIYIYPLCWRGSNQGKSEERVERTHPGA